MKMKRNKNNKQDPSIIGGTIAVPDNTIDISCRSDLTLDLDLHESPRPRQKKLDVNMLPPLPSRDADESTHYSPPQNGTTRRDYYDNEDGITIDDKDIDKIAEQAAYSCFGADADQKLDAGEGRPIRRSTLVAENSAIDGAYQFVICAVLCIVYDIAINYIEYRLYHLIHSFLHCKIIFYTCSLVVCCTGVDESSVIRTIPKRNGYQLFLLQQFEKA